MHERIFAHKEKFGNCSMLGPPGTAKFFLQSARAKSRAIYLQSHVWAKSGLYIALLYDTYKATKCNVVLCVYESFLVASYL